MRTDGHDESNSGQSQFATAQKEKVNYVLLLELVCDGDRYRQLTSGTA